MYMWDSYPATSTATDALKDGVERLGLQGWCTTWDTRMVGGSVGTTHCGTSKRPSALGNCGYGCPEAIYPRYGLWFHCTRPEDGCFIASILTEPVLVDFGQKNWYFGRKNWFPSILAGKKWFWSFLAEKTGFGRCWPKKLVLVDFDRKKLVLVNFGRKN